MTGVVIRSLAAGERGWPLPPEVLGVYTPERLWWRGTLPGLTAPAVAIVGSRRSTAAGMAIAHGIARDLAACGVTVVSGFARGIDSAAHAGALAGGGVTVAVCGCGLDVDYPRGSRRAGEAIAAAGGALISEFEPGTEPRPGHFPQRNRIIAALARLVIVVEAGERSGALSTARWAADLGRDVFAVPGPLQSPVSRGSNRLIRDGAYACLEAADVLIALGLDPPALGTSAPAGGTGRGRDPVLRLVAGGPTHPDEIAEALGMEARILAVRLAELELAGSIRQAPGGLVEAVPRGRPR